MNPLRPISRYLRLRSAWLGAGGNPVPPALAQARANVCLACPLNTPSTLREFFTAAAVRELTRTIAVKTSEGLRVEGESRLHICDACGCYLPLKVHAPLDHILATAPQEPLPAHCWVVTESTPAT